VHWLRCHILYMSFKGIVSAGRSGLCRASKSSQPFRGPASFSRSAYGFSVSKLFWECGHAIPVNAGHVSGAPDSCNLDFAFGVYREQSELGSRVSFQHCPRDFLFFSPLQSICRCFPNRLPLIACGPKGDAQRPPIQPIEPRSMLNVET
jgi:hypothetical protein